MGTFEIPRGLVKCHVFIRCKDFISVGRVLRSKNTWIILPTKSCMSLHNPNAVLDGFEISPIFEGALVLCLWTLGFPGGSAVKNLPAMQETWVQSLGWEDLLEKGMTTHSRILAWRIPWTEEPGGLQCMGLQKLDTTEVTEHESH